MFVSLLIASVILRPTHALQLPVIWSSQSGVSERIGAQERHERSGDQHETITPCLSPARHPPMNYSHVDVVVVMVAPACTTAQSVRLLKLHFNFRRVIYVVKDPVYCPWLQSIAEGVECLDENMVIPGLTYKALEKRSGGIKKGQGIHNRVGWYLQQYLKLGVALHLPGLSEHYLVWDADNIPIQPMELFTQDGGVRFCVNRGAAMHAEYSRFYRVITGTDLLRPSVFDTRAGSRLNFVCGYMVFYKPWVAEFLAHVAGHLARQGIREDFPWNIHRKADQHFKSGLLSEYDSYGSWLLARHPRAVHLDRSVSYIRNPESARGGGRGAAKMQCCLTQKRICSLSKKKPGGSGGSGGGSFHSFLIWEEHKFRYRGQDQCSDSLPSQLAEKVLQAGTGLKGSWAADGGGGQVIVTTAAPTAPSLSLHGAEVEPAGDSLQGSGVWERGRVAKGETVLEICRPLYGKYALELKKMWARLEKYCDRHKFLFGGRRCSSFGTLETELTYMQIREHRPRLVLEVGCQHGYSSMVMLAALKENGEGELHSHDLERGAERFRELVGAGVRRRWHLHFGDARALLRGSPLRFDYILVDAEHSEALMLWYTSEVFPHLVAPDRPTLVSVHDVYNPYLLRKEGSRGRKKKERVDGVQRCIRAGQPQQQIECLEREGIRPDGPSEEGKGVVDFVMRHGGNALTLASMWDTATYNELVALRHALGIRRHPFNLGYMADSGLELGDSPSLFFTLNVVATAE